MMNVSMNVSFYALLCITPESQWRTWCALPLSLLYRKLRSLCRASPVIIQEKATNDLQALREECQKRLAPGRGGSPHRAKWQ
jgi:hypothetical protein